MKSLFFSLWIAAFGFCGETHASGPGLFDLFEIAKVPSREDLKILESSSPNAPEMIQENVPINCYTFDTNGKRNSKYFRRFQFQYHLNSNLTAFMTIADASVGEPLKFHQYGERDLVATIGDETIFFRSLGSAGLIGKVNDKYNRTVQYIKCLP